LTTSASKTKNKGNIEPWCPIHESVASIHGWETTNARTTTEFVIVTLIKAKGKEKDPQLLLRIPISKLHN
jgi:hypothetical protein